MNDEQVAELASTVIDQIADIVVVLDQAGTIRYANARAEHMLGMQRSDWIGRPVFDIVHPDDLSLALELLVSTQAAGSGVREPVSYRIRTSDDRWVTIEVLGSNIELDGGEIALALSGREISIRRPGLEIVNEVSERLARMFDDAAIGMMQMTLDGRLLRVNPAFAEMLGLTAGDLVGRFDAEFTQPEDREIDRQRLSQLAGGELATYRRSKRYLAVDDRTIHVELTASLVRDRHGHPLYCAAQTVDVTALRAAEAELLYRSTHDPLTDLANRVLLHTLLDQALSRAARRGDAIGILFLDLDGFKLVNDTHGHAAGDALLVQVAQRLRGTVPTVTSSAGSVGTSSS